MVFGSELVYYPRFNYTQTAERTEARNIEDQRQLAGSDKEVAAKEETSERLAEIAGWEKFSLPYWRCSLRKVHTSDFF